MQGVGRQAGRVAWAEWVALAVVAILQAGVCAWTPLMVSPDGMDYLSGAVALARGGGVGDVVLYKAPGLTFVLAGVMWASGGGIELLHWVQAGLGVVTAVLVWLVLRRFGRWRALVGGLMVGVHPVLLVYQGYLLRESLAAFLLAVLVWLLVVAGGERGRGAEEERKQGAGSKKASGQEASGHQGGMWVIVLLGVTCGALASLRENGAVTLMVAPALTMWLGRSGWTRRLAGAGAVLAIGVVCVLPWVRHVERESGHFGVTVPKTQFNRAVNAWWNGMLDGTELEGLGRGKSDYEYVARVLALTGIARADGRPAADVVVEAMSTRAEEVEAACRGVVETAIARRPSKVWRDRGEAFVGLMGLWDLGKHPAAKADGYNALALRGKSKWGTNFLFDVEGLLRGSRFARREPELREVLKVAQDDIGYLKGSSFGRVFDAWWRGYEWLRYVLGWGFFIGLGVAIWRRARVVGAIAVIVLVNLGGAAWVVMSPTDRVAAPFIPLMVVVAVYGLGELVKTSAERWRGRASKPQLAAKQG